MSFNTPSSNDSKSGENCGIFAGSCFATETDKSWLRGIMQADSSQQRGGSDGGDTNNSAGQFSYERFRWGEGTASVAQNSAINLLPVCKGEEGRQFFLCMIYFINKSLNDIENPLMCEEKNIFGEDQLENYKTYKELFTAAVCSNPANVYRVVCDLFVNLVLPRLRNPISQQIEQVKQITTSSGQQKSRIVTEYGCVDTQYNNTPPLMLEERGDNFNINFQNNKLEGYNESNGVEEVTSSQVVNAKAALEDIVNNKMKRDGSVFDYMQENKMSLREFSLKTGKLVREFNALTTRIVVGICRKRRIEERSEACRQVTPENKTAEQVISEPENVRVYFSLFKFLIKFTLRNYNAAVTSAINRRGYISSIYNITGYRFCNNGDVIKYHETIASIYSCVSYTDYFSTRGNEVENASKIDEMEGYNKTVACLSKQVNINSSENADEVESSVLKMFALKVFNCGYSDSSDSDDSDVDTNDDDDRKKRNSNKKITTETKKRKLEEDDAVGKRVSKPEEKKHKLSEAVIVEEKEEETSTPPASEPVPDLEDSGSVNMEEDSSVE
ncbi:hypothetical protein SK128_001449, partial [Halocaridina rubra]